MEEGLMPTGLQMPAGEPPVSRKKAVPPRPDESRTWNFLSGDGPSAPPPAGSGPTYYQQPKPFKPGWKERRKEECINQSAERKESEARQAARKETHGKLRFAVIADKRDYTGVDPIKGTVRDEVKAVPPAYGRRGMPERSAEVLDREARKAASAEVRLTLRQEVLVNEGLAGAVAKGARVKDNFDAALYNPRATTAAMARPSSTVAASPIPSVPSSRAASVRAPSPAASVKGPSPAASRSSSRAPSRAASVASAATAREIAEVQALP